MADDGGGGGSGSTGGSCSSSVTGGSIGGNSSSGGETSRLQLLQEMRQQNFDSIRFSSYRTACKLRFIQKKVNRESIAVMRLCVDFK
ncbi:hypothetical protein TKK_0008221 [Trichogramma kaykai]